jgi:hypothetical protein
MTWALCVRRSRTAAHRRLSRNTLVNSLNGKFVVTITGRCSQRRAAQRQIHRPIGSPFRRRLGQPNPGGSTTARRPRCPPARIRSAGTMVGIREAHIEITPERVSPASGDAHAPCVDTRPYRVRQAIRCFHAAGFPKTRSSRDRGPRQVGARGCLHRWVLLTPRAELPALRLPLAALAFACGS